MLVSFPLLTPACRAMGLPDEDLPRFIVDAAVGVTPNSAMTASAALFSSGAILTLTTLLFGDFTAALSCTPIAS